MLSFGNRRRPIPRGLSPPAQGWRVREPTLGPWPDEIINRNAVAAFPHSRPWATLAATALRLGLLVARGPKVAASRQPWALGRNPFGIQGEPCQSTLNDCLEANACKVRQPSAADAVGQAIFPIPLFIRLIHSKNRGRARRSVRSVTGFTTNAK
jgi:hypothetical protein